MNRRNVTRLLALVAVVALVAAGCGRSSSKKATSGGGGQVKAGPGFDGTTITLGVITPQSGAAAVIGNPLTAGNQVFWDAVNAKGGIGGKYKVQLKTVDSKYDTATAVQLYGGLKNDVVMFNQILGTAINKAILPQLKTDKLVAAPASLDADWVREQNLLPVGGPYQIQAINAMDYYVNQAGGKGKKICAMRQDDPYGEAGLAGVDFAAKEMNFQVAAKTTFKNGDKDFTAQLGQLKSSGCEAVFLVSLPTETSGIMSQAAQQNYAPQWIGQSPTWVSLFANTGIAPYMSKNFLLAAEGTQWGDESVPGMKQMVDAQKQFKPDQKPDIYFSFGYLQSWAVDQVLEKAVQQGDLTRDGIINAMNNVGTLTFGGLSGDYKYGKPADRNPPRQSTLFKVDPAAPGGLGLQKASFASDAAKKYQFK